MTDRATSGRVLIVDDDRALRHALARLLEQAGYDVVQAGTGSEAEHHLAAGAFALMLLDVGLPGKSGLDVLAHVRTMTTEHPRVVVITSDDTPETLLKAIHGQADRFLAKPFAPGVIVGVVQDVLRASPATDSPIEVVSARPEWVELVAPCSLDVADRIHAFVMQLEASLPEAVRESVGQSFHELLRNAVEWGGKLDPTRKVRISCIRARRMLIYRIADPGKGFDMSQLAHAAINNPKDNPLQHSQVREDQGLRPGGLGLVISRSLVDEVIYNQTGNEVVLIKYLD